MIREVESKLLGMSQTNWTYLTNLTSSTKNMARMVVQNAPNQGGQWVTIFTAPGLAVPQTPVTSIPTTKDPGGDSQLWPLGLGTGQLYQLADASGSSVSKAVWTASFVTARDPESGESVQIKPFDHYILGEIQYCVFAIVYLPRPDGVKAPVYIPGPIELLAQGHQARIWEAA